MNQNMGRKLKVFLLSILFTLPIMYLIYELGLYISNLSINAPDAQNKDLHGFTAVAVGLYASPLVSLISEYIDTKIPGRREDNSSSNLSNINADSLARNMNLGLSIGQTLLILVFVWSLAALFCQLLDASVYDGVTDVVTLDLHLDPISAEKIQNTIRGTLYFSTYSSILATSSFVSSFLCNKAISYLKLMIPATCMYLVLNVYAIQHSGQPTILLAAKHMLKNMPNGAALQGLVWFVAVGIFFVTIAFTAGYGWLWAKFGAYLIKRVTRARLRPSSI